VESNGASEVLFAPGLEVRPADYSVFANGLFLGLSRRELCLLSALMRNVGRTVPREELYLLAWETPMRAGDRSVDVFVRKLRVKLEAAVPEWRFIHTHFGLGYRFFPEPVQTVTGAVTTS
jgi:DNA-binding response OmpR family regulator